MLEVATVRRSSSCIAGAGSSSGGPRCSSVRSWLLLGFFSTSSVACSHGTDCREVQHASARLRPAPPGAVRLIAVGDVGDGNSSQRRVAHAMSDRCIRAGGCDAVMLLGDNFYDSGVRDLDDAQWVSKFEEPYSLPSLAVPFYAVLGNHDTASNWFAQIQYTYLPVGSGREMRRSARWEMPAMFYDVRIRYVQLFALDTMHPSELQARSMSTRLRDSDAIWKITFGHHPRYSSKTPMEEDRMLDREGLGATQRAAYCGADLFVSGHDHHLELIGAGRDPKCPNVWFVVSGAGSRTSTTDKRDRGSLFAQGKRLGFAYLELTPHELYLEFVDACGNPLYSATKQK